MSNRYRADLRDVRFVLFEQFKLGELLGKAPYEAWGEDEVLATLKETHRIATTVTGPINSAGDREGCRLENGQVKVPAGYKKAWDEVHASGLKLVSVDPEFGGQGG